MDNVLDINFVLGRLRDVRWDYEQKVKEYTGDLLYEAKKDLLAIEQAIDIIAELD